MRASANSMSRELAQLASYFQLVFLPENAGSGEIGGVSTGSSLLNKAQLDSKRKPVAPNLRESLLELNQFTPSPPFLYQQHQAHTAEPGGSAPTSASMHSRSSGGLMRGLGGIFASSSSSLPKGGSNTPTNPPP